MDNTDYMANNTDYIESYFKGTSNDLQKQQFEKRILEDVSFAEEVAFYISGNGLIHQQLQEEKKQKFREIYDNRKVVSIRQPVKNLWRYMAAASVIVAVLLITWFFSGNKNSPQQLADEYIQNNFVTLRVTMGNQDSVQRGKDLFNANKLTEALAIFEAIAKNDTANNELKKYAGLAALRLKDYDRALKYFTLLEADTVSFSNPGKLYKAITLMERNKNNDEEAAKLLLQQISNNNLEGKDDALELLKKLR